MPDAALDRCRHVTIAGAGFRAPMKLRPESLADLADETLAYALRGRFIAAGMTVPASGHLVGVRVANTGGGALRVRPRAGAAAGTSRP